MNETLNVIHRRRSIRKYKSDPIPVSDLEAILNAGLYAPSGMNRQSWHFTVLQDSAVYDKVKQLMKEGMLQSGNDFFVQRANDPNFVAFYGAPVLVIISADEKAGLAQLDCGGAAENIALAAESLNIGSCVMLTPDILFQSKHGDALKKELGIPEGYKHVISLTLGYADGEIQAAAPRRENLINYIG